MLSSVYQIFLSPFSPAFEVADIINLMGHVGNCTGIQDPVSGREMIPVYRDETKEVDMASLITTSPSCVVEANSGEDGDLSCEQFWQSSSYYMSSYSSYSWSSGSFPWSSSSGWSSGSSAWPIGGTVWHPGVPMSAWSSGSWSSGSWSSGSWSSGSWSSSGGPWWTSCLSSGYFSFPPMRPDGGRPFPGLFESGSGWSTGLFTWSGGFQFPGFRDQWLRGAGTGSGAGPNPGSGGSSFGLGPMSGSGIDPRFNRGGRIGNIVRK